MKKKQDQPILEENDALEVHPNNLPDLVKSGIPLERVTYHKTVASWPSGEPEYSFYSNATADGQRKSRQADLWFTPIGILMKFGDEKKAKYKLIPLPNAADTTIRI